MPEQTDDISKCHGLDEFSPDTARFRVLLGTQVADNRPLGQGNRCAPACFNNGNYRGYSIILTFGASNEEGAGETTGLFHIHISWI